MARLDLVKQLAENSTRPLADYMHQPVDLQETAPEPIRVPEVTDLFVWFEDTSARRRDGTRRGTAGLPESLLPWPQDGEATMQVVDRRYAEGHLHLLSAVRLRVNGKFGERIAALYTAALSVGTVAWIGTGAQYERAWADLYTNSEDTDRA
jgi:hypothetical protein